MLSWPSSPFGFNKRHEVSIVYDDGMNLVGRSLVIQCHVKL
ncbi:hypothetical protein CCACVL1_06637 [Corchorus capsularis]|uniref:Uncharacterized protein n=1 Tax=Corchorus capsularis TaxID=210143 RepID=A0A1R3JE40_COCAP|nr:hypothetical protein CCACVL1_06637 [Corchorus capsularis]